jgi:hypothetical protein
MTCCLSSTLLFFIFFLILKDVRLSDVKVNVSSIYAFFMIENRVYLCIFMIEKSGSDYCGIKNLIFNLFFYLKKISKIL